MTYRLVHVGLGGQGSTWATDAIPPNVHDDRIEVVAAVDTDPERHELAEQELGLSPDECYTDLETALSERPADICSIVTPPSTHEAVVETALAHDLHIISEKPIADTLEASVRVAEKVNEAGKKMGVTMSHRFDQDKATFRRAVEEAGDIDYLTARYTGNVRERGFYADYVYEMENMLLLDGAIHHLDILASLADSPCERVYAETWTPDGADYDGDCTGLVTLHFADGTRAQYEGSYANATTLNGWGHEQFRAECSDQTVVLDRRDVERFHADDYHTGNFESIGKGDGETVPLAERPHWKNAWLIEQFCDWIDGGDPMPTNVDSVLQSMAIVFAAIESSETGEAVDVQALLEDARANA
ncbi:Predicted dehydrogenase [Haloarcula vallismortis]|uniref:Predicted dehydrogenase n=2 Tax=Haloarcula vallismortis TaxID=28442 RepID=A0A1H2SBY5_HALVA|nr:Gfo/Idh/MocA family oxidoreductase [Haloarcula vallismortis]EMA08111.1 putative glucose-fructose oxidoreductase [Haloarcula vallismortis ATCC 29715]SDW29092.1 Predicted dehydrogenase [Haloarcula vallismortis]